MTTNHFRMLLAVLCLMVACEAHCQIPSTLSLSFTETVPAGLLVSRSVVLHDPSITQRELEEIQKAFQQIGIDAVAYFEKDVVLAGQDITKAFAEYFTSRQIKYLLFFEKTSDGVQVIATVFNQKSSLFDPVPAWREQNVKLNELLRSIFQDSWRNQKKQNFLVNEFPETDILVDPIKGKRQEFYAIDLKVDNLAVPKFGNEEMDKALELFFQANYPLKYKITDAGTDEQELRKKGFSYVLCFVHTRGSAAREILGYNMTKVETAYPSFTFPEGQLQLKTLPAEATIYKFYVRHIDNQNVFLGTKWDADITWQDALRNHFLGFKMEARIN